ncbi:MAG: MFS transporter [Lachnospiraceae bacterium]|nr:MFS transporter [Lachnospiraceae bacterium]
MKLKTGQTIRIGFAFLSICAFWQMYNGIVPLILSNTFHLNETISGGIMALDNVLGLFLLPFFGGLSDKCKSKMGRRKPFILFGTIAAAILMLLLPLIDNSYYETPTMMKQILFIGILGALLVVMGTYRSPAVALMPDCTPKPLRSQGNAIINLMGAVGGILYLAISAVLYNSKSARTQVEHVDYFLLFAIVAGIMLLALVMVMTTVNEVKITGEMQELEAKHPEWNLAEENEAGEEKLPADVKKSLILILASVSLWFISYNALETWFTTFANREWGMALGNANTCLTIATGGAILSYVPAGGISSKIGRKKTIMIGVAMMAICFVAAFVYYLTFDGTFGGIDTYLFYVLLFIIGMGWAFINVNSLPMVIEMCKGSDVGKFTGYYYTFSMAAQIVTPILCGALMRYVGYWVFFPYAFVFMIAAFITMKFVKHGDAKGEKKSFMKSMADLDD